MANTTGGYTMVKPIFKDRKFQGKDKAMQDEARQTVISKRLKRMSQEKTQKTDDAKSSFKY